MSQVFISYSRKDIEFVDRLANDLKAAGFEVWYDLSGLEAGTQWGSEIQKAIETSQFFLVVLSPNSIKSSWVEREFLHASDQDIKIIPLLYQQCALPMWSLNLHFIDMQGKNYARNFTELLRIMGVQPEFEDDNPIAIHYIKIGDEYRKRGQAAQAIESYTQALKADPNNLKAQSNIGAVHLEEQAYQEAAAAFELALQISSEDLVAKAGWCDAKLSLGNQARADGKIEEATGFYLEVLRVSPDEADARKSLANISKSRAEDLLAAGKEDQAISAISEALTYTPQDASLSTLLKKLESEKKTRVLKELFARSDQALATENWEGAIAPLNEALESSPQDESILKRIELIREQQREEQLKDILLKVERAEESGRWDTAIAGLNEYLQMKKDDKAVQKRMADLMASKRSTWLNSINLQVGQAVENRQWDEALQVLNEALEIEPDNKELITREAQVKKDQISVKINAIILRAEQAAGAGHWDDSIEILNKGLIDNPDEKILKTKLAEIMQSKREQKLKSALNLADMAARTEKWETAVATLNEVLASEPDNPIFLRKFDEILNLERNSKIENLQTQAQNLVKAEKFEAALAAWNELLTIEPENRQAVLNEIEAVNKAQKLAELYSKATEAAAEKDHLKAVEYFKRVEIEDANYKNAARLRAKAEKRLGAEGKAALSGRRKFLTAGAVILVVALGISAIVFWPDLAADNNGQETNLSSNTDQTDYVVEATLEPTPIPTAVPVAWKRLNSLQFIPRDQVTVILEDPTDQDVWYAGTSNAGIYKTINGGASWAPSIAGLSSANIDTLVIDPTDPNTLYAGLINGGVSKTTDGGNTWFAVNHGIQIQCRGQEGLSVVVISPLDTQHLYFTDGLKVYETRDGGGVWTLKYSFNNDQINQLVIHPENDNILFMATIQHQVNGKVWKSEDSGNSWVELFEDTNNEYGQTDLWVDHVNGDLIYYIDNGQRLYISQDGGLTWNSVASLEDEMGLMIGTPWVGNAAFVLNGSALYQTTDSGSTWTRVGWDRIPFLRFGDLEVSAQDNPLVYVGTSGVYLNRLDNQGWIDRSVGLGGVKVSLYLDPSNNNSLYMTVTTGELLEQGDLFASEDGGINWELRSGGGERESRASFTAAAGDVLYQLWYGSLVSSVDKGKTWSEFGGIQGGFSLFVNPYQSDIFVVSRFNGFPVVSHDHGGTWEEIVWETDHIFKMAFVKNQPDLMYVLANEFKRSEDGGVTWEWCGEFDTPSSVDPLASQGEPMAIVDPRDGNHLLVATWDGIISTMDGCRTWQYSNNGLYSLKVNTISADPNNPDIIYAGTDNGAYVSFDSGDFWQPINDGLLSGLVIYSIVVDIDSNVYAATPLGVFQLEDQ